MNSENFMRLLQLKNEIIEKIGKKELFQISRWLRDFIFLANSASIRLLQSGSFTEFADLNRELCEVDALLCRFGSKADQNWQGRLVSYLIQAFFTLVSRDMCRSMRILQESHELIEEIKEAGGVLNTDLKISLNFMSFAVLWKNEKYGKAKLFLGVVQKTIENTKTISKVCRVDKENIENLMWIGLAALKIKAEGNFKQAKLIAAHVFEKIKRKKLPESPVLQEFWNVIHEECRNSYLYESLNKEILLTQSFEEAILETCIVPFISENLVECGKGLLPLQCNIRTHKRTNSGSDKVSTKSSLYSIAGSENKNAIQKIRKNKLMAKAIPSRITSTRMAVYSPTIGIVRPKSTLRGPTKTQPKMRPKSQERCKFY